MSSGLVYRLQGQAYVTVVGKQAERDRTLEANWRHSPAVLCLCNAMLGHAVVSYVIRSAVGTAR
jgi:hypothetical protein